MNRNRTALVLLVAGLALTFVPLAAATCAGAGTGSGCAKYGSKDHACSKHCSKESCAVLKGATMKVENLEDGVKISLTSDKPEAVQSLREHAATCAAKGGDGAKCMVPKGARVETADLVDGVEIHLTSDDSDVVKSLQEHAAKRAAHHAKGEGGGGCSKMGHARAGHGALPEGAKVEVENLDNGATITMTSDDPEVVKAIQAHANGCAAKCKKSGK